MRIIKSTHLCPVLSLVLAFTALAQTDRGAITGTVSDPAGAVIPAAAISARNTQTGAVYETVTTGTGNYTLPQLPAGVYDLKVSASGFSSFIQQGIRIQVVQTARIDVALTVGSTAESVTVTADAPLLSSESAEQSKTLTGDQINALPLGYAGGLRNPIAFAQLAPGASISPGSNLQMRVNGTPSSTYRVLVDGQDITSGIDPTHLSESHPSMEALEQVTLQSSNFAAEFGQVSGGLFNLTSRSGTNQYHGTAYEYLTDEWFNAGRPFTDDGNGKLVRPVLRNHDYGFTVGGPVIIPKVYNGRQKTFFFFNFEQFRTKTGFSGTFGTVPTEAYRRGDFSAALINRSLGTDPLGRAILENTVYDPGTQSVQNGQIVRNPFPGNIMPVNLIDPISAKVQALIPAPTQAGNINNFAIVDETHRHKTIPSIKVDQYFGAQSKMSFYYGKWMQDQDKNTGLGLPEVISPVRSFRTRTDTVRLTFDHAVTPTSLVHVGLGGVHYDHRDSTPPGVLAYDAVAGLGLRGSSLTPSAFPRITGLSANQGGFDTGGNSLGPTNAGNYFNDKPTAIANATLIRGNHTFKLGAEYRKDIWTDINKGGAWGIYNFSSAQTGLPYLQLTSLNGGSVGFPYASFLLGAVNTASAKNVQDPQLRKTSWGMYVQDTWKLTRKLTLDFGLRWDYENALKEIHDRTSMLGPSISNPSAGGLPGAVVYAGYGTGRCNCNFTDTYPFAFGPRIGVAYKIDDKTVLRAGWGFVFGTTANVNYMTGAQLIGVGYNIINFSNPSFGDPALMFRNGLQYNPAELTLATLDPGLRPSPGQINTPPYYLDRSGGRPSRINQWNISLQRQLTANMVLEVAYVGNRGVWLQADPMLDLNDITVARLQSFGLDINRAADRTLLNSRVNSPAAAARGFSRAPYESWPTSLTVAQSLRPFPQFGNITERWPTVGNSWYDSLQAKFTKRYSHGFDLTTAFTWQKELNLGAINAEAQGASAPVNDPHNRMQNKYISAHSQPLILAIGFTYKSPAVGSHWAVRSLLRDWTVGGFLRYSSGLPIESPSAQNGLSTLLFRGTYANRVPGQPLFSKDLNCHCIDPNKDFVLNPAAWQDPGEGQWGTSAGFYNDYRFQRRPSEQLGIGRLFQIRERMSFEVRGEAFNVFNRTQIANPDSGNALAAQNRDSRGVTTGGFGRINPSSLGGNPRQAQLLLRFQF